MKFFLCLNLAMRKKFLKPISSALSLKALLPLKAELYDDFTLLSPELSSKSLLLALVLREFFIERRL